MNAALLAKLIEAGTPADLIAEVAVELGRAAAAQEILERRKTKDRERSMRRMVELPEDWRELRISVFERDGWACVYCGAMEELQCDHIMPLSKGGSSDLDNLATACKRCNSSKRDKLLEEWQPRVPE